jgi:hypothetical protein
MAGDKKQLADLQDKVLQKLRSSEGLILDNQPLITALQQSKQTRQTRRKVRRSASQ